MGAAGTDCFGDIRDQKRRRQRQTDGGGRIGNTSGQGGRLVWS